MKKTSKASHTASHSHAGVHWGPLVAVVLTIGVYFVSQIITSIALLLYPAVQGWDETRINTWLETSVSVQFWYGFLVYGITLAATLYFIRRRKTPFSLIGLVRPKLIDSAYALVGYGVYFALYVVTLIGVSVLAPNINLNQDQEVGFEGATGVLQLSVVFVSLVVLPAIVEEVVTRGFLYSGLRTKLPKLYAAIGTSVVFAVAHLQFGSAAPLLWVAAIDTFVLSMVLVYVREQTGGLAAGIGVHALKNTVAFLSLFVFV